MYELAAYQRPMSLVGSGTQPGKTFKAGLPASPDLARVPVLTSPKVPAAQQHEARPLGIPPAAARCAAGWTPVTSSTSAGHPGSGERNTDVETLAAELGIDPEA